MSPSVVQENGSRNKRKFRADPPLGELNKIIPAPQHACFNYEFSAEKFEISRGHVQATAGDLCSVNHDRFDGLKLGLGLCSPGSSSKIGPCQPKEEVEADEYDDIDWNDLTEAQLEELVLSNLDAIFKSAIREIVACGYTEEVARNAVSRSGICYGCKDTVSNIVDNTLPFLRKGQEVDTSREHYFEDLVQLEKYILAEMVCVLREVRPFFSTGDAMWCLLICDMNVSHACAMDVGPSRGGKQSGLSGSILDKKLKPVSESSTMNKSASLQISKAAGVEVTEDNLGASFSPNAGPSAPAAFNLDSAAAVFRSINTPYSVHPANTIPAFSSPSSLSTTDTDLSLSLSSKTKLSTTPVCCNNEAPNSSHVGKPFDKSLGQWVPQDKKDEVILKLVPKARGLQNQVQEWTEWANQKVMQAACRLGKDKVELKTLRQEKDEVERLKKEKQSLEENTIKKLSEMENALCKASGQVQRANAAVQKLKVENAALRREMEAAKLRAAETATNFEEVSRRERKTQLQFQSWEKQKFLLQEELMSEKHKSAKLLLESEQAKMQQEQVEARWQQEAKAKEELLLQASSIRKEREQIEELTKSKEDIIKSKAEKNLQRFRDDIHKLEKEIAQLRLKSDSSKIAALKMGIDGSYASRFVDMKNGNALEEHRASVISELVSDYSATGSVKRERECVMCLSEEMSVVFLPCAHQVVCTTCNELHEKQGMQDCPSCRSPIQRRIPARFTHI
ncbi:PREDICTED: putative E3 ubiquitin-protein ligase RF298 isoform X2 [Lupinus angustifolius]|uniref:putative E3 ubiquitin-protein ligase RF298 isoform X2 n=1 Tax=Lupinus angustifolius TaxID=3871 RepID=UPI00092EEDE4|nr:PREDICTED: putative E3 ubiquitin-protein ligase RF298 isoform X2 [Lupinus angustifolius]